MCKLSISHSWEQNIRALIQTATLHNDLRLAVSPYIRVFRDIQIFICTVASVYLFYICLNTFEMCVTRVVLALHTFTMRCLKLSQRMHRSHAAYLPAGVGAAANDKAVARALVKHAWHFAYTKYIVMYGIPPHRMCNTKV